MPIFLLTSRNNKGIQSVVRARCLTCARNVAAEGAGAEGPMLWRDSALSTVELVDPTGKPSLIIKVGVQA